jgi:hypothetical protein
VNPAFLFFTLLGTIPGQPPAAPPVDTMAEAAEASTIAKKLTDDFVVEIDVAGDKVRLMRDAEPALRWTNHLGRRYYGDVYVWTHKGRPEVVASVNSIFVPGKRGLDTEIVSLSTGRPVLSARGMTAWQPAGPGVEFKPLPGAPKPAMTPAARLVQLRALAGQFAVVADYGVDKEQKEDLRLLATPVSRYQSADQAVTDGALFAFTKGTDPDVLLMIEARKGKDGVGWQYALARLNGSCGLLATLKGDSVWQAERLPWKTIVDPKQPYFVYRP